MKLEILSSTQRGWSLIRQEGFSLVEIILSSAVFVMLVTAFVGAYLYGEQATMLAGNRLRATLLAEEAIEAVRNIRDPAFSNIIDGTFGLVTAGNQWSLSGSQDVTGIFTRQVTVATVDAKRKIITSNVIWQQNPQRTGSVTIVSRLTNWIAAVANMWVLPTQAASLNLAGNTDGIKVQTQGDYAYVIRGATSANFVVVNVTDPAAPSVSATLSLNGTPQNLALFGNYAFVASDSNAQELQIINIASPTAPVFVGSFDSIGNQNASGIVVSGNTAFLSRKNGPDMELLTIDITTPAVPTLIGSLELGANANDITISGNYAFISSDDNNQELKVINISNLVAPTLIGSLNLAGNVDAESVVIAGSTILLGQGSLLYVVDITTPVSPLLLGSVSAGATIGDIALALGGSNSYVYLATSNTSNEFRVVDISIPSTPTIHGSFNVPGTSSNLFGVAYNATTDRAYSVGQSDASEFIVFAPQ